MSMTWDYADLKQYRKKIAEGMPPLIITCAVSGDHQKSENPNVPVTAEEQADEAAKVYAAGAAIIHIHGRESADATKTSSDPARYYQINTMMRAKAPDIIIDNTHTATALGVEPNLLPGTLHRYKSAPTKARPEVLALNPRPMTFAAAMAARAPARWSLPLMTRCAQPRSCANAESSPKCSSNTQGISTSWIA